MLHNAITDLATGATNPRDIGSMLRASTLAEVSA
jgi:hypothetical protein